MHQSSYVGLLGALKLLALQFLLKQLQFLLKQHLL